MNPYLENRKEFNDRYAELAAGKRNWQVAAAAASVLALMLGVGLVVLSTNQRVIPYLLRVDELGYVGEVKPLHDAEVDLPSLLRYQLVSFIQNSRSITPDQGALKVMLENAYVFTAGGALAVLDEHYKSNSPFQRAKTGSVSVRVRSVLQVAESSWKIHWEETERGLDGLIQGRTNWEAYLETSIEQPTTEEQLMKNPLGLYVTQLSWTRQL